MAYGLGLSSRTSKQLSCKPKAPATPTLHTWGDIPLGSQVQTDPELKAKLSFYEAHALAILETRQLREKLAALEGIKDL